MNLEEIVTDLIMLGLKPGDSVLVHSSLKSIGHVDGGPATVVAALRQAVGPEGTVLFPALSGYRECSPDNPPEFDVRSTPSLGIGIIPETARTTPGAVRSLSPTHSVVAFGLRAVWFCESHHRSPTPCGSESPYDRLVQADGRILLIGCDHNSNTSVHMLEEKADVPYHMLPGAANYFVTDSEGKQVPIRARFHRWGEPTDFNRIEPYLLANGVQTNGRIGYAQARLVSAAGMERTVLPLLTANPRFLLV